jgi:hypothetical protein
MYLSDRDLQWAIDRGLLIVRAPEGVPPPLDEASSPTAWSAPLRTVVIPGIDAAGRRETTTVVIIFNGATFDVVEDRGDLGLDGFERAHSDPIGRGPP